MSRPPRNLGEIQERHQRDEFRTALRALLMRPLLGPGDEAFPAVRRQAEALRDWFARETGWPLHVERDGARLYKRPADLSDPSRGLPDYDRRRYALLCLACAVLERADPQITLRLLGEKLLLQAADPALAARGFSFTLGGAAERRDLVTVCRTLLGLGVLQRVAGDEEGFIRSGDSQSDALYDIHRRALAGLLAAVRGPSTWRPEDAPATLETRLQALVAEHLPDSDEGRRTALRHHLSRRLLDDPVVYAADLEEASRAYFANQRGALAARLAEAAGLAVEQRAEGLALPDESGLLTDVELPAEGTDSHVTLLAAAALSGREEVPLADIAAFLAEARQHFGRYWRKSAREPGSEGELAAIAVDRLEKLLLVRRDGDLVRPRPALSRFALGETELRRKPAAPAPSPAPSSGTLL